MSVAMIQAAFADQSTTGNDRLVMLVMAWHADEDHDIAWPTLRTIAAEAHIAINTVRRALQRLTDQGLLELVDKGSRQRSARYRLCIHLVDTRRAGRVSTVYPPGEHRYRKTIKTPTNRFTDSIDPREASEQGRLALLTLKQGLAERRLAR